MARGSPRRGGEERGYLSSLELAGRRLAAALVALELKADLLPLMQRAEARALYGRRMNEDVRAAIVGLDEAEAFGGIEPLNSAKSHMNTFQVRESRAESPAQDQIREG